jgi:cell division inhibitor SepF
MSIFERFLSVVHMNDDGLDDDEEFFDDEDGAMLDEVDEFSKKGSSHQKKKFGAKKSAKDDAFDDDAGVDSFGKFSDRAASRSDRPVTRPVISSKVTPIRSKGSSASVRREVCVIKPTKLEEYREIADTLLSGCTVVLNLEGNDVDAAQRIIDLSSGSCYALGGGLKQVSSYIFLLTPPNVEISGDINDFLTGGEGVPSMRTSF